MIFQELNEKEQTAVNNSFSYHAWKVHTKFQHLEVEDVLQELRYHVLKVLPTFNSDLSGLSTFLNNQIKYAAWKIVKVEVKKWFSERTMTQLSFELSASKYAGEDNSFDIDVIASTPSPNYDTDLQLEQMREELASISSALLQIFDLLMDGERKGKITKECGISYHELDLKVWEIRRILRERKLV